MWEERQVNQIPFFTVPSWTKVGAEVYYSCRLGGESGGAYESMNLALHVGDDDSTVVANRRRFLSAIDHATSFVTTEQTHSRNIVVVDQSDEGRGFLAYSDAFAATDGLVTATPNLILATFYADCLPLACVDPVQRAIGAAHSGWKGTLQNIGGALVETMAKQFGSRSEDLLFAIGAAIGPCCYEVGNDFYEEFAALHGRAPLWFRRDRDGHYFFDNVAANVDLLTAAGVERENIDVLDYCTCCRQDLFYSYRGSGGTTGRQGLFVRLR